MTSDPFLFQLGPGQGMFFSDMTMLFDMTRVIVNLRHCPVHTARGVNGTCDSCRRLVERHAFRSSQRALWPVGTSGAPR